MDLVNITILIAFLTTFQTSTSANESWRYNRCPKPCVCEMRHSAKFSSVLRTVDCSALKLTNFPVPEHIPSDVQVLNVAKNHIANFPADLRMWLPDLIDLDLSHNQLTSLPVSDKSGIFEGVYNLKSLNLASNHVNLIADDTFQGLFNLESLSLENNLISSIADNGFRGLTKLESLTLTGNKLAFIQQAWWSHLTSLYNLFLDSNALGMVQSDSFKPLTNLQTLDLSDNQIFRVGKSAFAGLEQLQTLDLNTNALTHVPVEPMASLRATLRSMDIGRNPIHKLRTEDFAEFEKLKDLSLAGLQGLKLVERGTFKNLPQLILLQMHDCPAFSYLDQHAFVNLPNLSTLQLHNNNLTVLERPTLESVQGSLEQISFYGNPLSCDCNARWLKEALMQGDLENLLFQEIERMVCSSPSEHRFKLFTSLRAEDMPRQCPPQILSFFPESQTKKAGESVTFDCRTFGVPSPRISWVGPKGKPVNAGEYHARQTLTNGNTLTVTNLSPSEDSGIYTCIAESDAGQNTVQTSLIVQPIDIRMYPVQIKLGAATVQWQGADIHSRVFQVVYREIDQSRFRYAGTVTPMMHSYTVRNLRPNTEYQVCLDTEVSDWSVEGGTQLACTTLITGPRVPNITRRLQRSSNIAVGAALGVICAMLIVLCLAFVALKRSETDKNLMYGSLVSLESGTTYTSAVGSSTTASGACSPVQKLNYYHVFFGNEDDFTYKPNNLARRRSECDVSTSNSYNNRPKTMNSNFANVNVPLVCEVV